ncbi:hypothetical protein GCM10018780_13130 [Streptomyces lanatus]|nr:hypothetical protein GCM10018780_13130 [Streptomyces lanatus]
MRRQVTAVNGSRTSRQIQMAAASCRAGSRIRSMPRPPGSELLKADAYSVPPRAVVFDGACTEVEGTVHPTTPPAHPASQPAPTAPAEPSHPRPGLAEGSVPRGKQR